jgi:hypothetical protein
VEELGGKMFGKRKVTKQIPGAYASRSDFCRIFNRDVNGLYLLSLLLTADRSIAEQCFVGGLHTAQNGNQVFKEWAESWARRAVIQNALRLIRPRRLSRGGRPGVDLSSSGVVEERAEIAAILDLPPFERFAFVMSVLERYSDQECSLLLDCTRGDVAAARSRALDGLGKSANLHRKLMSTTSKQNPRPGDSAFDPQLTPIPSLAASA